MFRAEAELLEPGFSERSRYQEPVPKRAPSVAERETKAPLLRGFLVQGRQDSNLQPPVLETGALPVELRP
jgi:hypothetical protein